MKSAKVSALLVAMLLGSSSPVVCAQQSASPADTRDAPAQDARARTLLDAAKNKLQSIPSLVVDFQANGSPTTFFDRTAEIALERPNRFRVESIGGAVVEERTLRTVSDGQTISTYIGEESFVAYEQPVRRENFFLGQNFLVQFFFDPRGIAFDPSDPLWGRPVSHYEKNLSAYDRDTQLRLLGARTLEGRKYQVVEIKYNTARIDIRQQIYIGEDQLVYQVDTSVDGQISSQKFRNFRIPSSLPATTWRKRKPDKMPLVAIDPVRLGAPAPEFTLPGTAGGEFTLKQLLEGKKGLLVCALDGLAGRQSGADAHLPQMQKVQQIKNKFERQGLAVVVLVGGSALTPDLKDEMLLNWLPDLARFNYPILLDFDLERGIQGNAYPSFQLSGRNSLLLDPKGRVVFAATSFLNSVNELSFYQALAQLGFAVSSADLESAAR
ncbi:MAG: hypothetical protein ACREXP_06470 [Steroidobacteraceae bacterium]